MPSYAASTSGAPVSGWHGSCATPAWSVHARRRWRRGRPDTAPAPDLVNRRFDPPGPDRVWAADVTQFRTGQGWLYLAGVIDLYSRRVVGWAMSDRPDTDLVTDALMMAFPRRRPDRRVVHHSDRGAVYTSLAFSHQLTERSLAQSFGSTSDAHDNAAAEAFWATLKRELAWIHQRTTWSTRTELRTAVFDHIEAFYNPERIPRRLGHHNPRRLQEDHRRRLKPRVHRTGARPTSRRGLTSDVGVPPTAGWASSSCFAARPR
jgi:putative transposase